MLEMPIRSNEWKMHSACERNLNVSDRWKQNRNRQMNKLCKYDCGWKAKNEHANCVQMVQFLPWLRFALPSICILYNGQSFTLYFIFKFIFEFIFEFIQYHANTAYWLATKYVLYISRHILWFKFIRNVQCSMASSVRCTSCIIN